MNRTLCMMGLLGSLLLGGCTVVHPPLHDPGYAATPPVAPRPAEDNQGAIYQPVNGLALFEDVRAHRVGDILTVQLVEKTNASKKAATSTKKDQDVSLGVNTLLGRPVTRNGRDITAVDISGGREFSGDGASSQSNTLTGNISVTIADVLANGNLVVRGEKLLSINQGDEFIRIAGIVRPVDVSPDNMVLSTKIADAQITYGGRGALADSNRKGWLARFFDSPVWPF